MKVRFILGRGVIQHEWTAESLHVPRFGELVGQVDRNSLYRMGVVNRVQWVYEEDKLIGASIFLTEVK